jgi:hypothetical protein
MQAGYTLPVYRMIICSPIWAKLHEIWMAQTRQDAHEAFDHFVATAPRVV